MKKLILSKSNARIKWALEKRIAELLDKKNAIMSISAYSGD